jgi:ammonia channel protein AmtB
MSSFVYPLAAHWAWHKDGWLYNEDYIDLAGSGVVHIVGGSAALIGSFILGPRYDYYGLYPDSIEDKLALVDVIKDPVKLMSIAKAVFDELGRSHKETLKRQEVFDHTIVISQQTGIV